MRKALVLILGVCLLAMMVGAVSARDIDKSGKRIMQAINEENDNPELVDLGARSLTTAAAVDSYCLAWFDFEQMNWQGWTFLDNTAQVATFFHVDDFVGLGGGDFGLLTPLEGTKSMWCGSRPAGDPRAAADYFYLCSWSGGPGYGNSWNQILETGAFPITGLLTFSYHGCFDSEGQWDYTYVQYDKGDDNWVELAAWDDEGDTVVTHQLLLSQVATKLRFNFIADGAWSDSDGGNYDGAAIIDEILVTDNAGTINSEDWEDEALDVTQSADGFWTARGVDAFGNFCGLANNLVDKDPCGDNSGTQVIFFQGSSTPSGDYPGLLVTPFCTGPGGTSAPCQDQALVSPVIDMTMYSTNRDENQDAAIPPAVLPGLGGLVYMFTVYCDLPLANLVFYTWSIRSLDGTGCPLAWKDRNFVYYGGDKDYIQASNDVSDLFESDEIQVRIGVSDMCDAWFEVYGDCANHTPSPWIDNCRLYRYETVGPQWSFRDLDLFQDTFPFMETDLESWGRADAANDLIESITRPIIPGDSIVVTCTAPMAGGLDTLATGEERIYAYVYAQYIGIDGLKSDIHGAQMQGDAGGGTWTQTIGNWDVFLMPNAKVNGTEVLDKYMLDLNDSLFTRGYQINYYFKAYDLLGATSNLPATAEEVGGNMFEFTILPTLNSEMLFVDDFSGRGTFVGTVQTYWEPTFAAVIPGSEMPDRYDVNAPSSLVSNGPGSRAWEYQMKIAYEKIIWDCGDLNSGTITEGTDHSDKSNDTQMLVSWMNNSEHKVGLMVMGDQIAYDLTGSSAASALTLMSTICGVTLVNPSYYELTGGRPDGVVSPLVTGVGIYAGVSYYAFGGCPIINSFDVLEKTGATAAYSLQLPDVGGFSYYIGISNQKLNSFGYPMRTSWIGNSMQVVRTGVEGVPARNILVKKTWEFFQNGVNEDITDATIPAKYALMQNYPNPFNPTTTISFNLPEKANVSLKIYNVAGQLVRTLTDQSWDAGSHEIKWNGTNDLGSSVASGVYFYKIDTASFQSTKKMVLLK